MQSGSLTGVGRPGLQGSGNQRGYLVTTLEVQLLWSPELPDKGEHPSYNQAKSKWIPGPVFLLAANLLENSNQEGHQAGR